jgi:hypothetical protein
MDAGDAVLMAVFRSSQPGATVSAPGINNLTVSASGPCIVVVRVKSNGEVGCPCVCVCVCVRVCVCCIYVCAYVCVCVCVGGACVCACARACVCRVVLAGGSGSHMCWLKFDTDAPRCNFVPPAPKHISYHLFASLINDASTLKVVFSAATPTLSKNPKYHFTLTVNRRLVRFSGLVRVEE